MHAPFYRLTVLLSLRVLVCGTPACCSSPYYLTTYYNYTLQVLQEKNTYVSRCRAASMDHHSNCKERERERENDITTHQNSNNSIFQTRLLFFISIMFLFPNHSKALLSNLFL